MKKTTYAIPVLILNVILFSGFLFAQETQQDSIYYYGADDTLLVTQSEMDSIRESRAIPDSSQPEKKEPAFAQDSTESTGFRYQYGFRSIPWGSDLKTAREQLGTRQFVREDSAALAWYDRIAADSVFVRMYFYDNQFWQVSYSYLFPENARIEDYYDKFERLEEVLVKKYGNPDKMRRLTWDDSPYIGEVDAIAMGQGLYQSRWFFPDNKMSDTSVIMELLLQGVNFKPTVMLQYSKPAIIQKTEKVKEDTLLQYY